jgi:trk system potassium uptake protein
MKGNDFDLKKLFPHRLVPKRIQQTAVHYNSVLIPVFLVMAFSLVLYDVGFHVFLSINATIFSALKIVMIVLAILMGLRFLLQLFSVIRIKSRIFNFIIWLLVLFLLAKVMDVKSGNVVFTTTHFLVNKLILYSGVTLLFFIEVSPLIQFIYKRQINPALLFLSSFAFIILLGTILLYLPQATTQSLRPIDAFFTATSAVCVTGLTVVDTAVAFTTFGQFIILVLIQIGGLGIMTFAGLLAYAVTGGASFRSQLAIRDMLSRDKISNVMHFVYRIIVVTLFFELIGAFLIYFSLPDELFNRQAEKIFVSIFHAVSAFCNAGFSTFSLNLFQPVIRYNYNLQLTIALLVILGGMGFPIVFNLFTYLTTKLKNFYRRLFRMPARDQIPRLININSRLALVVSGLLLLIGFIAYFIFELQGTLLQHPTWYGKLVTCFFASATPRTAGFNTTDLAAMALPTIMIFIFLMWIGASPGSTGGGIKTTTVGVAVLNLISIIQGKDRTEFFRAEISNRSIQRAFAIIILSFLIIGVSIFLITINDGREGLVKIAFESFSAFSTVGLTLGITPGLSTFSKFVLIVTMFIGRVGVLTVFIAFVKQSQQLYYRYPKEEITF